MKKFILLVIPSMENAYRNLADFVGITIPIGISTIAAMLEKKNYAVEIIDGGAEGLTFDGILDRVVAERPDYVGSTTMTATMDITSRFYENLKKHLPDVRVIVGDRMYLRLVKRHWRKPVP